MNATRLLGGCHCRAVRYELGWPGQPAVLPARRCSCSYCRSFNGTWTSHPDATLIIHGEEEAIARYRFATQTADFVFCSRCGVPVFVLCRLEEDDFAIVNVNTLNGGQPFELDRSDSCFDGESTESRLGRRRRNWIARVDFS